MTTNKERIENLEAGLGGLQEGVHRMEMGMADKLIQLETTINRLSEVLLSTKMNAHFDSHEPDPYPRPARENQEAPRLVVSSKTAKLEFPRFEGGDPTEWFARVDQFFEFQATAETQKVRLASFHLEGEANQWWRWMSRTFREENRAVTWAVFEEELWARFGPTDGEDFDEALSHIRQDKSLREYQQEFEKLGNRVQGWTQKALVGTFMGGLKSEIAEGIRMFKPRTLKEAINLARMKDEQLVRQRRFTRPTQFNRQPTIAPVTASAKPAFPVKRLSWEEMQRRRAMGLCFNCDDKFAAGHKCRGPQLLLLEAAGDNNNNLSYEEMTEEKPDECVAIEEPEPQISLYALTGWSSPKTMRVTAQVETLEVVALIDSGSTHNFISDRVAQLLRLSVISTDPFPVRVANGEKINCQGRFEQVTVHLQGIPFMLTLYALPIAGLDLVLGVQWLEMLGPVVCDWKQLTMGFMWDNTQQQLQGIDMGTIQEASVKELSKEFRQGLSFFAICPYSVKTEPQANMNPALQKLLAQYQDIFSEPTQLPPQREVDHCITLKEGIEPVNVRPYRYAYF